MDEVEDWPEEVEGKEEKKKKEFDDEKSMEKKFRHVLLTMEDKVEKKPKAGGPPVCTFKLIMISTGNDTVAEKPLPLAKFPETTVDIKDGIEATFSIPASIQTIKFGETVLEDGTSVSSLIKDGDTLEVSYLSDGELEDIRYTVNWIRFIGALMKNRYPCVYSEISAEADLVASMGMRDELMETLALKKFRPWESPVKQVNIFYFIQMNGLDSLIDLYTILLNEPWRTMHTRLRFLEDGCILAIASVAISDQIRKMVISLDGVGMSVQSFLRVRLRRGNVVWDTSEAPGRREHNNILIRDIMGASLEVFKSFREYSEVHKDIAMNPEVVEQMIALAHSPSFSLRQAQIALLVLSCCAHSPDSCRLFTRGSVIDGILDTTEARREMGASPSDILLLKFYSQVLMAQLILSCPEMISRRMYEKILEHMVDFLKGASVEELVRCEAKSNVHCSMLFPYIKLIYQPKQRRHFHHPRLIDLRSPQVMQLQESSVETVVITLHCILSRPEMRRQLVDEDLRDYVFCFPDNLSLLPRIQARKLLSMLRKKMELPVPKLSTMARARLAKLHFGLDKVQRKSAEELRKELHPPPPVPSVLPPSFASTPASLVYIIAIQ